MLSRRTYPLAVRDADRDSLRGERTLSPDWSGDCRGRSQRGKDKEELIRDKSLSNESALELGLELSRGECVIAETLLWSMMTRELFYFRSRNHKDRHFLGVVADDWSGCAIGIASVVRRGVA